MNRWSNEPRLDSIGNRTKLLLAQPTYSTHTFLQYNNLTRTNTHTHTHKDTDTNTHRTCTTISPNRFTHIGDAVFAKTTTPNCLPQMHQELRPCRWLHKKNMLTKQIMAELMLPLRFSGSTIIAKTKMTWMVAFSYKHVPYLRTRRICRPTPPCRIRSQSHRHLPRHLSTIPHAKVFPMRGRKHKR